jgi:hypothetical protein
MFFKKKKDLNVEERRTYKRVDFIQSSYFQIDGDSKIHDCWFNNISLCGLSIDVDDCGIKEGDEILVLYKIGTKIMKDRVRIIYITRMLDKLRCGCSFINKDDNRASLINKISDNQ